MALRYVTIGSGIKVHQFDDGDFDEAIETDAPIACAIPWDADHVLRYEDIAHGLPYPSKNLTILDDPYAATIDDYFLNCDCIGGNINITLPTAIGQRGKVFIITKTDASANTVIVDAFGAETINGSLTATLTAQYQTLAIYSDGANWLLSAASAVHTHDHNSLLNLAVGDVHTQYALLLGRGGETLNIDNIQSHGGSGNNLIFNSNSAKDGLVVLGNIVTGLVYDEDDEAASIGGGEIIHTINGVNEKSLFEFHKDGNTAPGGITFHRHSNNAALSGELVFIRSRGDHATPLIVQDGDSLGGLRATGFDGTDEAEAIEIDFEVDDTPGNDDMAGRIVFKTSASGTQTPIEALRIDSSQGSLFSGDLNMQANDIYLDTASGGGGYINTTTHATKGVLHLANEIHINEATRKMGFRVGPGTYTFDFLGNYGVDHMLRFYLNAANYMLYNKWGTMLFYGTAGSPNYSLFTALAAGDANARIALGLDNGAPFLAFGPGGGTARDIRFQRDSGNLLLNFGAVDVEKVKFTSTYMHVNSLSAANYDFLVSGDTEPNLFRVDTSVDEVHMGDHDTNFVSVDNLGDVNFVGGAGLQYGCINYHGVGVNTVLAAQDTWYQMLVFNTDSQSNGSVTPDHTNDHITIGKEGDYQIFIGISGQSAAANDYQISVWRNNGATRISPVTIHQTTAVAGRVDTESMMCFAHLEAADTIEVWIMRTDGGAVAKTFTTVHAVLNVEQIGG